MKPQESVYKEHAENRDFESRLAFYKDELSIFENLLENFFVNIDYFDFTLYFDFVAEGVLIAGNGN